MLSYFYFIGVLANQALFPFFFHPYVKMRVAIEYKDVGRFESIN
jgi:hypothetical protein